MGSGSNRACRWKVPGRTRYLYETDYRIPGLNLFHACALSDGQAHSGLGQHTQAAEAYSTYMERIPGVLDAYVQEYRGDELTAGSDYPGALDAYQAALTAPRLDDGEDLQIKIAGTRADFGDYAGALVLYDQIISTTTNDYVKAQMITWQGMLISPWGRQILRMSVIKMQ